MCSSQATSLSTPAGPFVSTTTTITSTSTNTTTVTTTLATVSSTTTLRVTGPTPALVGLKYYQYNTTYNYSNDNNFNATTFQGNYTYWHTGLAPNVNAIQSLNYPSSSSTLCQLPGQPATQDCAFVTIFLQGFFYSPLAGDYNYSSPNTIDNYLAMWHGTNAYSTFTNANSDYQAIRAKPPYTGGSTLITLSQYAFFPITIAWVNGGGIGKLYYYILTPAGTTISDTTGYFIPPCDTGSLFIP